jgi:hypothetical protein
MRYSPADSYVIATCPTCVYAHSIHKVNEELILCFRNRDQVLNMFLLFLKFRIQHCTIILNPIFEIILEI